MVARVAFFFDSNTLVARHQSVVVVLFTVSVKLQPYPYQAEALDALETKGRVAFAHGMGAGATTLEAMAALEWAVVRSALVLYVAPTRAIEETFWRAVADQYPMGSLHHRYLDLPGRGEIFGMTGCNAESWQGILVRPERPVLIILGQASVVPEETLRPLELFFPDARVSILMTGYPSRKYIPDTDPPEPAFFYRAFTVDRDKWHTIQAASSDCPWVSSEWIEGMTKRFGWGSDICKQRVLGEFPE